MKLTKNELQIISNSLIDNLLELSKLKTKLIGAVSIAAVELQISETRIVLSKINNQMEVVK